MAILAGATLAPSGFSIGPATATTATITASGGSGGFGQVLLGTLTPNITMTVDSTGLVSSSSISFGTTQSPGIQNVTVSASYAIHLDTGTTSNVNLTVTGSRCPVYVLMTALHGLEISA